MQFDRLAIEGAVAVRSEPVFDERGAFCRIFSAVEFAAHGLADRFVQHSVSLNKTRGTIRGLHYQAAPRAAFGAGVPSSCRPPASMPCTSRKAAPTASRP
jgi:dTDP-4-dehydrorhamnose 3,5-epimerase-like enzyme